MQNAQPAIVTSNLIAKNPDEIRLLTIADPHMASSSPDSWKADYKTTVEASIEQVLLYGIKSQIDAVVYAGDLFHRKSPDRNPLWFVEDCMRLLKKSGVPNVGVAGNHDLKWGSLEGLEGQPISLLIEAGVFQLLDQKELLIEGGGFNVRIGGDSYEHGRAEGCRDVKKQGATWLVSVGHFWFGMVDGEFGGEPLVSPDFLGKGEADIYVIGHKHEDQGIVEKGGKYYVVPGSVSLTGEKPSDNVRRPAAALIKITKTTIDINVLRPKVPPITDLIDMEKRAIVIQENQELETFVSDIATAKIKGTDPKQIMDEMELAADVRKKVEYFLELAATTL